MIKTPMKNWWLLALCGVLDGLIALVNVFMFTKGPGWIPDFPYLGAIEPGMLICRLAVAAGVCTIAAGIWSFRDGRSWLLALNGLALCAFGLLPILWTGPLGFRPLFTLLLAVMATSIGILALATARTLRRHAASKWFLGVAGAASVGFALAFLALAFGWITPDPGSHSAIFLWLAAYFGFSAICVLGLSLLRPHGAGASQSVSWQPLSQSLNPKSAH